MKLKTNRFKKNLVREDYITKAIEQARDMTYWYSERF